MERGNPSSSLTCFTLRGDSAPTVNSSPLPSPSSYPDSHTPPPAPMVTIGVLGGEASDRASASTRSRDSVPEALVDVDHGSDTRIDDDEDSESRFMKLPPGTHTDPNTSPVKIPVGSPNSSASASSSYRLKRKKFMSLTSAAVALKGKLLKLSLTKLSQITDPEVKLRRCVLIYNAAKALKKEIVALEEKRGAAAMQNCIRKASAAATVSALAAPLFDPHLTTSLRLTSSELSFQAYNQSTSPSANLTNNYSPSSPPFSTNIGTSSPSPPSASGFSNGSPLWFPDLGSPPPIPTPPLSSAPTSQSYIHSRHSDAKLHAMELSPKMDVPTTPPYPPYPFIFYSKPRSELSHYVGYHHDGDGGHLNPSLLGASRSEDSGNHNGQTGSSPDLLRPPYYPFTPTYKNGFQNPESSYLTSTQLNSTGPELCRGVNAPIYSTGQRPTTPVHTLKAAPSTASPTVAEQTRDLVDRSSGGDTIFQRFGMYHMTGVTVDDIGLGHYRTASKSSNLGTPHNPFGIEAGEISPLANNRPIETLRLFDY